MIYNAYAEQNEQVSGIQLVSCGHVFAKHGREIHRHFVRKDWLLFYIAKEIINKTNAKIICVGDDYQSIYRFNGCDLNMFLNFKKYFSI